MGTVACCWCRNGGGGGDGGNSAIADYNECESYRPESRRSGLGELLRNQLTRGRRGSLRHPMDVDSRASAWQQRPEHEQEGGNGSRNRLGETEQQGPVVSQEPRLIETAAALG